MSASLPFATLENKTLRLDYLTASGPRIIGLHAQGVDGNLLAETPQVHWTTPHGEYYLRGGHRLWIAPEDPFFTPPEGVVQTARDKDRVTLSSPPDASGLEKEISFSLDENRVHLNHRITWHGERPLECSAWAITQLRLGGLAILPLSPSDGPAPDRNVVLWPYSQLRDDRLELQDDVILLHGQAGPRAFKIGTFNKPGWIACVLGKALFIKRFSVQAAQPHPDLGCNVEAYIKDVCLELETLGPLKKLNPGESLTHEEHWQVLTEVDFPQTLEGARAIIARLSLDPHTQGAQHEK